MAKVGGDASAKLHRLKDRYPGLYNIRPMIDRLTPYFEHGAIPGCQAGRTYFNIDAYGNITRCEEQRRSYGNLKQLDHAGIRRALAGIRLDTLADGCSSCYLRTRGETEPLYEGGLENFVACARDMFGLPLPKAITHLARRPAFQRALGASLDVAARLEVL
jgi:hypothetical protein